MLKILLVDDDQVVLTVTSELLKILGHTVFCAEDGAQARILVDSEKEIDLVLLDISLPDVSGLELFPELLEKHPGLSIAICSGNIFEVNEEELKKNGVSEVLCKPFDIHELHDILQRVEQK